MTHEDTPSMTTNELLLLRGKEVQSLLSGRECEVMAAVRQAYVAHALGKTSLPQSSFLRFPDRPRDRVIALPAFLDGADPVAGIKWIASFPDNLSRGLARASALIVLNSTETGRPTAILEGSLISAERTAASAAVALSALSEPPAVCSVGLIGCGVINAAVARYLLEICPGVQRLLLFDLEAAAAERLTQQLGTRRVDAEVRVARSATEVLCQCQVTSLATTAMEPYLANAANWPAGALVLNISLRDLKPDALLACDNVVDDVDHVCRAGTSIELVAQQVGHRRFIRCTLADVLLGRDPAPTDPRRPIIFSPFGLGILDLAVARMVCRLAREQGLGLCVDTFFP